MAGYNYDELKSYNALEAQERGLVKASTLAVILDVETDFIKENMRCEEWHHTGKFYSKTKYYNIEKCRSFLEKNKWLYEFFLEKKNSYDFESKKIAVATWTEFYKSRGKWHPRKVVKNNLIVSRRGNWYFFKKLGIKKKVNSNANILLYTKQEWRDKKKTDKVDLILDKILSKRIKKTKLSDMYNYNFWIAKKGNKIVDYIRFDEVNSSDFSSFKKESYVYLCKKGVVYECKCEYPYQGPKKFLVKVDGDFKDICSVSAFLRLK